MTRRLPPMGRLRVAFVVQRYGLEVNGGAERLCRLIAERIGRHHDVEVLTTRAKDYVTWRDEYPPGMSEVNGVPVHRFSVDRSPDPERLGRLSKLVFDGDHSVEDELAWMRELGPQSSGLLKHFQNHGGDYDAFVFFTYLFGTTFWGLPLVRERAVLVPTAHDERVIYLGIFDRLFQQSRYLLYNSAEERAFLRRRFFDQDLEGEIVGLGVESAPEPESSPEWDRFQEQIGGEDFVLYVGRIDEAKGAKRLVELFGRYLRETGRCLKLVMCGSPVVPLPERDWLMTPGFVSETFKLRALGACRFMIAPSPFESLCIAALEAWTMKKAVLANGQCATLRGQCRRANAGLWYCDYP
jgi:glycosyltransferase involved in cell wall biosynthesis